MAFYKHINVSMFLLLTPSSYSGQDLLNYKSVESSMNFLAGWVREVFAKSLVTPEGARIGVVITKVSMSHISTILNYTIFSE